MPRFSRRLSLLLTLASLFVVSTLAAATAEEKSTLEDIYEPFLMQIGFLQHTPRGRVATPLAYKHFGLKPDRSTNQQSLFEK